MIEFIHSIWLSLCWWQASESWGSIPSHRHTCFQNNTANCSPGLEIIVSINLYSWKIYAINKFASSFGSTSVRYGTR
jgi:hypothetical protein